MNPLYSKQISDLSKDENVNTSEGKALTGSSTSEKENSVKTITAFRFSIYIFLALFVSTLTVYYNSDSVVAELTMVPIEVVVDGSGKVDYKDNQGNSKDVEAGIYFEDGSVLATDESTKMEIVLNGRSALRLDKSTKIEILNFAVDNSQESKSVEFSFKLDFGRIWLNDLAQHAKFSVFTNKLLISPLNGSVSVDYSDNSIIVQAVNHGTRIEFLNKNFKEIDLANFDLSAVLNQFLLTEKNKVVIGESKISDKLLYLRPSKLLKEFPFDLLTDSDLSGNDWIANNMKKDDLLRQRQLNLLFNQIKSRGVHSDLSFVPKFFEEPFGMIREVLTFAEDKKQLVNASGFWESLENAEYFAVLGQTDKLQASLKVFQDNSVSVGPFKGLAEFSEEKVDQKLKLYVFVLPGADLYKVKESLIDFKGYLVKQKGGDYQLWQFEEVRNKLYLMEDLISRTRDKGKLAIDLKTVFLEYSELWRELKPDLRANDRRQSMVWEERNILQNLLFRIPLFYEKQFFKTVSDLEDIILSMSISDEDLREARLQFVFDKLKVLARLIYLIKEQAVDIQKAVELGKYLTAQSNILELNTELKVAISDYFQKQLSEFALLLAFFESPEFAALKGSFDEEVYKRFLKNRQEMEELQNYVLGSKAGESEVYLSIDQRKDRVRSDFKLYKMEPGQIEGLGDNVLRLFKVKDLKVEGEVLQVKYDVESQIVYEIEMQGKFITSGPHVSNLAMVVKLNKENKSGNSNIDDNSQDKGVSEEEDNVLSKTEELAVSLVLMDLSQFKITASKSKIDIVDFDAEVFYVNDAVLQADRDVKFSFKYNLNSKQGSGVKIVSVNGENKNLDKVYGLEELAHEVKKAYYEM